jgi:hypothetical protein
MQVLCTPSTAAADIQCPICSQSFHLCWERNSPAERQAVLPDVLDALRGHHKRNLAAGEEPHPAKPFNVPDWSGQPQFSGAALLGGAY